ncbi:MAG TPA: cupin domain-containing protein [Anaerolineaceae bacterium]|nr:cupin domain-containing protein [Anaerolineaceae bacterium]
MDEKPVFFKNVNQAIDAIPTESIVSRTFLRAGETKAILFAFDKGQELSEHTAAVAAILHFVDGEAELTFGDERHTAASGSWVFLPPRMKHSVMALTPLKMLLYLLPSDGKSSQ